jgi:PPP family 3-phenylpropionic acid transporter
VTARGQAAVPGAATLGAAYATHFAAHAASFPFLALVLGGAGFAPDAAAQVLALCSVVRVVAIPAWTIFADRARASGVALGVATAGAALAFGALAATPQPSAAFVVAALIAFAAFRAPFGPLLDAVMLWRARASGAVFGAVRAIGTAGYAVGGLVAGLAVARWGARAVPFVTLAWLAAALVAAGRLGRGDTSHDASAHASGDGSGDAARPTHDPPRASAARELLRLVTRPRIAVVSAVALLQQLGLAAYDALVPAYLTRLADARVAGAAVAVGAASEFVFLAFGARWLRRLGPERLLAVACGVSTLRWIGMAVLRAPSQLVALQALHAVSFGAFYMAGVVLVDAESPRELRASAQGAFGALCFGVGGALGLSAAGGIERCGGGVPVVFGVAAGASALAGAVALLGLRQAEGAAASSMRTHTRGGP